MSTLFLAISFMVLASSYTANKALLAHFPIHFLSSFKLCVAGSFFLLVVARQKGLRSLVQKVREDATLLVFICIVSTAIPYYLKMNTLKHLNSSEAMLLGSLDPFITAFYSYFIFQEVLEKRKICGIACGFFSVFWLLRTSCSSGSAIVYEIYVWSIITAIAAIFIGRYGWILTKKLLEADRYSYAEINLVILMGSGLAFLGVSCLCNRAFEVPYCNWDLFNRKNMALLLYTTVASNIYFYYVYSYFIKHYSITQVSYTGLIIPLSCHFLGWLFLGETLSAAFLFSFVMMFADRLPRSRVVELIDAQIVSSKEGIREFEESDVPTDNAGVSFVRRYGLAMRKAHIDFLERNRHFIEASAQEDISPPSRTPEPVS